MKRFATTISGGKAVKFEIGNITLKVYKGKNGTIKTIIEAPEDIRIDKFFFPKEMIEDE